MTNAQKQDPVIALAALQRSHDDLVEAVTTAAAEISAEAATVRELAVHGDQYIAVKLQAVADVIAARARALSTAAARD